MINQNQSTGNIDIGPRSSDAATFVWLTILTLAGIAASFVISCVTPFAALAVALAGTVRMAKALRSMTLIWLANQVIGVVFFNFTRTLNVALWGLVIGVGALLSTMVAAGALKVGKSFSALLRLGFALLPAFVVYEAVLFLAASVLGGVQNFSAAVVGQIGLNNLISFSVMVGLNELGAVLCEARIGKLPRLVRGQLSSG